MPRILLLNKFFEKSSIFRKKLQKKSSECTGTCGGSETSLNTVVHENVKVYTKQYVNFFWNFLKFFQELPSTYIFINYTDLSKFVKFVNFFDFSWLKNIILIKIWGEFWKSLSVPERICCNYSVMSFHK